MGNKLTRRDIDAAKKKDGRDVFIWCGELRGFGIRVKPSGSKSFIVQYKTKHGTSRRKTLGATATIPLEQAREDAKLILAAVVRGEDPVKEDKAAKAQLTVADLCDRYQTDCRAGKVLYKGRPKKASTMRTDDGRIRRHIKPLLGRKKLPELTRHEVSTFFDKVLSGATAVDEETENGRAIVTGGQTTAKKSVTLLSAMFTYAVKKGLADTNPCHGIELPRDNVKDRTLSPDEYRKLGKALKNWQSIPDLTEVTANAIWALALSGGRRTEICSLTPPEIALDAPGLRLKDSKTGKQTRPCGFIPLRFLHSLITPHEPHLFPTNSKLGYLSALEPALKAICKAAKLEPFTCHTLRHSYSTVAGELHYSRHTRAGLLGHGVNSVTDDYTHFVDPVLANAANRISIIIADRMGFELSRIGIDDPSKIPALPALEHYTKMSDTYRALMEKTVA